MTGTKDKITGRPARFWAGLLLGTLGAIAGLALSGAIDADTAPLGATKR